MPGRFQIVGEKPLLILDVAHNPHAAAYLANRLAMLPQGGKVRAVVGMLADKDIGGTLSHLTPQVDEWYCAPLDVPRGATAGQLAQYLEHCRQFADVAGAWRQAMSESAEQDIVIVCGSFHTVAQVMEALDEGKRMASKFQNRLVGTIVLVALGVIVLPGLLDGNKSTMPMSSRLSRWFPNRATATKWKPCLR